MWHCLCPAPLQLPLPALASCSCHSSSWIIVARGVRNPYSVDVKDSGWFQGIRDSNQRFRVSRAAMLPRFAATAVPPADPKPLFL
jgi:hypothetical protein